MFISSSGPIRRKRRKPDDLWLKIVRLGDASLAEVSKSGLSEEEKRDLPAKRRRSRKRHSRSDRKKSKRD